MENSNTFKFWDKYMNLEEEELKLFNFILQFDFGDGNREYTCEELNSADYSLREIVSALKFIICVYNDSENSYLAFLDIDSEGAVGYSFIAEGSEEATDIADAEIVAANIYAIASDALYMNFQ